MSVLRNGIGAVPYITAANGRKDAKSWIIGVLSREWPLPAKEIFNRIRNSNGNEITYQGIHKAILQLAQDGVLLRSHSKYSINSDWMLSLRKFGDELYSALQGKRYVHLSEIDGNGSISLVFDSMVDYFYWLLEELQADALRSGTGEASYAITYHPWPIFNLSKDQYSGLRKFLSASQHYVLCKGSSVMDRSVIELWKRAGTRVKLDADCSKNCDILAYRDFVIQLFVPHKTKSELGKIFNGSRHSHEAWADMYSALYENFEPVNVVVVRNPELANQIKDEVLSKFRNPSKG